MNYSLHDILKKNIKKMILGIGDNEKGNIHPLIMQEIEKNIIEVVLKETKNNYLKASRILGIGRNTLYRKIKSLDLNLNIEENENIPDQNPG